MKLFLPGWGTTAEIWAPFAAPADRLGGEIEAGAEVVAWSLGAMRALEAAASTPLASLTIVGASGQFVRGDGYRYGWPARTLLRMRERLFEDPGAVLDEFFALALAPGEEMAQPPREHDITTLDQGLAFLADYSMLERAKNIHCPVRLLYGGQDRICPLPAAELLAEAIPGAELTVWPEAGHAPFLSQPDRFRSWLGL
ncbi:MAG: alpha/beta fold hydrolase [Gaiellaceae bacterium]|jgi:pimeloyl-[acyl-carrier protein] methyl ester esterase